MHDQVKLEQEILRFWEEQKIYERVKAANEKGKKFYFCDGPPYATGLIHPGTAWNKCIKDAFCRYRRARGENVRAQPGYDTHGLPIEVKVEQELGLKSKRDIEKIGIPNFINRCKEFATQYIDIMSRQFKRCGVWMDWENPYLTYKDEFIEENWKTLKTAWEKGLLHRGVYVLPYCSRCETTMANYELEYEEKEDPSIYVKFKIKGSKENEYLVIWTTTPWTLVSNLGVMVHPTFTYVRAKIGEETWIVAKERLDAVLALAGESGVILGEMSGKKLEGIEYDHPLAHKIKKKAVRRVVLSDEFVTLEDGSGLVHCAPGHGPQDYIIGKRFGLEIFSPLDSGGRFTEEGGDYAGMHVFDANEKIIEDLDAAGVLIHSGKVKHRYPHCWRCKTPLIFLATDQWFISISKTKERMLEEIEKCSWVPDFARRRFREFVENAPDWCISRQRYWGIPLPIWKCEKCEEIKVIGSRSEIPEVKELHKPFIDEIFLECNCGGKMRRVEDVLDVWFDSGNAIWASLPKEEASLYPADFIVEGKDQIRGWFYSLLGLGIVRKNEIPYKVCLMHGHFVDEKGEKMSKSLGNFVPLEDVVDKYGADTFRLWSLSGVTWDDLKFNWEAIKEASRALGIFYNLGVFLERFCTQKEKPKIEYEKLELEDRWLLSRLNNVVKNCTESFEKYEVHDAARALRAFIVEDVSRFYMKLAKKRLNEERSTDSALAVLYHSILTSCKLAAPIFPFLPEHIYQKFFKKYENAESLSMLSWPEPDLKMRDPLLERRVALAQEIATALINARQNANIKLRWPLEEAAILSSSTEVKNAVLHLSGVIESLANVKKIKIVSHFRSSLSIEVNATKVGKKYKENTGKVLELLKKTDPEDIADAFARGESYPLSDQFLLEKEMVKISEHAEGFSIVPFSEGKVYLKTKMNEKLYAEAMLCEVSRRIQLMRKEANLVEKDVINVNINTEGELAKILKQNREELARSVHAKEISFSKEKELKGLKKEWEIEEFKCEISIEKA